MNPPSILVDQNFLAALEHTDDDHHDEAIARYRDLIDDFVEQRCLLVARADHLATMTNHELFAPIDKLHVARQHRNAAADLVTRTGIDTDEAITLVLLHRYRIRKVASFSQRFANYDTDAKVPVPANVVAADTSEATRTTKLASDAN